MAKESTNTLPRAVKNHMYDKIPAQYHQNWETIFFAMEGFHGRTLSTKFEDVESLKLIGYLSMHLKLKD